VLRALGRNPTEAEVAAAAREADADGRGLVTFADFQTALGRDMRGFDSEGDLRAAWEVFDKDCQGWIAVSEVRLSPSRGESKSPTRAGGVARLPAPPPPVLRSLCLEDSDSRPSSPPFSSHPLDLPPQTKRNKTQNDYDDNDKTTTTTTTKRQRQNDNDDKNKNDDKYDDNGHNSSATCSPTSARSCRLRRWTLWWPRPTPRGTGAWRGRRSCGC
jgi:hypothetical protein